MIILRQNLKDSSVEQIEFQLHDDVDIVELFRVFKDFCLAMGYHPDTVKEYFDDI